MLCRGGVLRFQAPVPTIPVHKPLFLSPSPRFRAQVFSPNFDYLRFFCNSTEREPKKRKSFLKNPDKDLITLVRPWPFFVSSLLQFPSLDVMTADWRRARTYSVLDEITKYFPANWYESCTLPFLASSAALSTQQGGCNGWRYVMEFVEEIPEGDEVVHDPSGIVISVAPKAVLAVVGTEMDYVRYF